MIHTPIVQFFVSDIHNLTVHLELLSVPSVILVPLQCSQCVMDRPNESKNCVSEIHNPTVHLELLSVPSGILAPRLCSQCIVDRPNESKN